MFLIFLLISKSETPIAIINSSFCLFFLDSSMVLKGFEGSSSKDLGAKALSFSVTSKELPIVKSFSFFLASSIKTFCSSFKWLKTSAT